MTYHYAELLSQVEEAAVKVTVLFGTLSFCLKMGLIDARKIKSLMSNRAAVEEDEPEEPAV